jgi:hypothetical protein
MADDDSTHLVTSTRAEVTGVPPAGADDLLFSAVIEELELGVRPMPGRSEATPSGGA